MQLFNKLKESFIKTKENFSSKLKSIFAFFTKVDEDFLNKLEESLIMSDVSVPAASKIREKLREKCKYDNIQSPDEILNILKNIIISIINCEIKNNFAQKNIILVAGINGVGKTTTIGKLANYYKNYKNQEHKILIAAADTFRAAAAEQLELWAERAECEIVKKSESSDPGAVVYEALEKLKRENFDFLICDTAGRLHNKSNLMAELSKINRIIDKNIDKNIKKFIFLVLDASTGQNMINQVEEFSKILNINGLIITKLDGTAKGGAIISIREKFPNIPIKYIGIGEQIEDLSEFDSRQFADSIISKQ